MTDAIVLLGGVPDDVADDLRTLLPGATVRSLPGPGLRLDEVERATRNLDPDVVVLRPDDPIRGCPVLEALADRRATGDTRYVVCIPPGGLPDHLRTAIDDLDAVVAYEPPTPASLFAAIRRALARPGAEKAHGAAVEGGAARRVDVGGTGVAEAGVEGADSGVEEAEVEGARAGDAAPEPDETRPDPDAALAARMAGLWERFRGTMLERVVTLEEATVGLMEGTLSPELRAAAAGDAHKLAGSLGTFGFMEATERARALELLLDGEEPLEPGAALTLSDAVLTLRRTIEEGHVPGATASDRPDTADDPAHDERPLLLVVDDDAALLDAVTAEARSRALRVRVARSAPEALREIEATRPDVALVALDLGGDSEAGWAVLDRLTREPDPVPALVWAGRDAFTDRVEVARRRARGFVEREAGAAAAAERARELADLLEERKVQILVVDDDPAVHAALAGMLPPDEMRISGLSDPLHFWSALEDVEPDILLLDVQMPRVGGLELCRVVRGDDRWRHLPVLFLTARTDPGLVERVFEVGGDDFIPKPIRGRELRARIRSRAERVRMLRREREIDELTGVATRGRSEEVLARFLSLAGRRGEPLAFAYLDVDGTKAVNDRWGHTAGDRALRHVASLLAETFRGEDVVARWGGEEFVIGMFGMDAQGGVHRLAETLERLRAEPLVLDDGTTVTLSFSAGVAGFPADGNTIRDLYLAADGALRRGKDGAGGRVAASDHASRGADAATTHDVVVVEDDEAVAELLLQVLDTRGYSTLLFRNGIEAEAALTSEEAELRPRLVLLDVNLPGMDGLSLLRRLEAAGVTERTPVIMLTARTDEDEVVEALKSGAYEHVAKPFSVPVLMQRIRRALADPGP